MKQIKRLGWLPLLGVLAALLLAAPLLLHCNGPGTGDDDDDNGVEVPPETFGLEVKPTVLEVCCATDMPGSLGTVEFTATRELECGQCQNGDAGTIPANQATRFSIEAGSCPSAGDPYFLDVYDTSSDEFTSVALTIVDTCPQTVTDPAGDVPVPELDCTAVGTATGTGGDIWVSFDTDGFFPFDPNLFYSWFYWAYFYDAADVEVASVLCQVHDGVAGTFFTGPLNGGNTKCFMDGSGPVITISNAAASGLNIANIRGECGVAVNSGDVPTIDSCPDAGTAPFGTVVASPACDYADPQCNQ